MMNKKVTEAFDEKIYLLGKGKDGLLILILSGGGTYGVRKIGHCN